MYSLKEELYKQCQNYIEMRMHAAQQAINEAQKASTDETKSSAGDKYETSREMMQQETNRNMAQLNEANKLKVALNKVGFAGTSITAEPGSIVITDNGSFYMAVSAGMLSFNNQQFFAVSPASPVGMAMKGLKAGDEFKLNNKVYRIKSII